jgi:hypothetical protein
MYGIDSSGSESGSLGGCFEHRKNLVSLKYGEFLNYLRNY